MTTVSTYFARDPAYVKRNLGALAAEQATWAARGNKFDPPDIWQDIFAKYLAQADPAAALAQWNRWGAVELGDSRTHTLHLLAQRSDYLARHIAAVGQALRQGVPLAGYMVWSLLDNFEWPFGYSKRFGIVHVDYATQQRTLKDSALWYRDFLRRQRARHA